MFRHTGKGRTYLHNLRLASLLSAVAGIVNIVGVLGLNTLTTNVTGHFAFLSEEFVTKNYSLVWVYLFYVVFFLAGAFVSSILIEIAARRNVIHSYALPISLEIIVLLVVSFADTPMDNDQFPSKVFLSCLLLFAMGLQNSLVTKVSQSVVRTTHLTGLFTDLGIELSQLLFYRGLSERAILRKSILLKAAIIGCFFIGGLLGGFIFLQLGIRTLYIPVALLAAALWYDSILLRIYHIRRKLRVHN
ncbi:LOW QUALITY PROTEIN: uncharacterized membrane protein YoaK (UPF0700 family) [Flavobacterium lindanitolerans]|uniref:Uncharacterized membrane protein YoaK (UPF0700 family) n=1 Tax=Flavobacterium lindanitolerans TaxID=428988 RepID=A0ABX4RVQ9_9FLAO|nr:LOW QUALITY PROTEIN: uncharacterized membrane protein YoaK (UPF0700 family) [Flavobacterium lindanitolerans]